MELFPEIEPYRTSYLDVSGGHRLYYEECGNPTGMPVLFLHGGPGAGVTPKHRRYFHPDYWRVILFDQRGAGQSLPHAATEDNTTWDLVADIERIRMHLGISSWTLFGGSWGSTLALCYAIQYRGRVDGMILRGIFLGREREVKWLYQDGASRFHPEAFRDFADPVSKAERGDLIRAYHRLLNHADPEVRYLAARSWSGWEGGLGKLLPDPDMVKEFQEPGLSLAIARLECHYCVNRFFLPSDNWIIEHVENLIGIPCRIIQGRYDMTCPPESAFALHSALPGSEWRMVADAGHSASDPSLASALVQAVWDFQHRLQAYPPQSAGVSSSRLSQPPPIPSAGAPFGPPPPKFE